MSALRIVTFFDLLVDVCLYAISNWMLPEDLSRFDSSVCNIDLRKNFLMLIKSKSFSSIGNDLNVPYSWIR
jgi:hypothetical protein